MSGFFNKVLSHFECHCITTNQRISNENRGSNYLYAGVGQFFGKGRWIARLKTKVKFRLQKAYLKKVYFKIELIFTEIIFCFLSFAAICALDSNANIDKKKFRYNTNKKMPFLRMAFT